MGKIKVTRDIKYGNYGVGKVEIEEEFVDTTFEKVCKKISSRLDQVEKYEISKLKIRFDEMKKKENENRKPATKDEALAVELPNGKTVADLTFKDLLEYEEKYADDTKIGYAIRLVQGKISDTVPDEKAKTVDTGELSRILSTKIGEKIVRGNNHTVNDASKKEFNYVISPSFRSTKIKEIFLRAAELGWKPKE